MPQLLPPKVVGPLSECSSNVRVKGQLTGATVDILANGASVGGGLATWSDQVFPLNAGVTLAPGAQVTATQSLGGTTSPPSPIPIVVMKRPGAGMVGNVGCKTHIYRCGQCLWLDGMVPGAKVEVKVGGVLRGAGQADDGTARISLSQPTALNETLVAQQTACGMPGLKTPLPPPDPVPNWIPEVGIPLPAPTVGTPLRECQRAVTVSNVFEGSQVTLTQSAAPAESSCFDQSSLWFPVPPLKLGETVQARQEYPGCQIPGQDSFPGVKVVSSKPVPPPTVVPPLCAGTTTVRLTGLLPGSKVRIFQGTTELGEGEAPDSTFDFEVPPLAGGTVANPTLVSATQELCNNWSVSSNEVKVDPKPGALPVPNIAAPLYECGAVVRVTNLHKGATVEIWSTMLQGPISPATQVYHTWADIPVSPQLINGDNVYAVEVGCGQTVKSAPPVLVLPVPRPQAPQVQAPVDDCMRSVTVSNVLPGARVDVYVNNAWRGMADAGADTVEIPILYGPLQAGDLVKACQHICQSPLVCGDPAVGHDSIKVVSHVLFSYLTQHFDNARTGWRPYETVLTVANVPQLKQLFTQKVDGTVYAQPLYVHHVLMPGPEAHNVVYVATENDTVYAFDADTKQPYLWKRSLIPAGEHIVSTLDITGCPNIAPVIGITSTPVVDNRAYIIYVAAKTKEVSGSKTTFHYRLYALDIATGADRMSPVEIAGSVTGTGDPNDGKGHVVFDPHWHLNRPGLLLLNGVIYVGFGSHCDFHLDPGNPAQPRYHGWVFGFDAATFAPIGVFSSCPDTPINLDKRAGAGIWQGGMGLAADPSGFIYFTTGNGDLTAQLPGGRNYGDSVIKLQNNFTVADYFTPSDQPTLLAQDIDLGSGGVLVLPVPAGGLPLVVACGKDGNVLLMNRNNMGKYTPGGPDQLVQFPPVQLKPGAAIGDQSGVWGGPAYYHGANQQFVYYCGSGGYMKAYVFSGAALALSMIGGNPNQSPQAFPSEGGATPNVSSNQQTAGTGVLWAITRSNPLRLQAFDATNLTNKLFDAACGPWNNANGGAFIEPTTIQGRVYVPSDGQLTVFGL